MCIYIYIFFTPHFLSQKYSELFAQTVDVDFV